MVEQIDVKAAAEEAFAQAASDIKAKAQAELDDLLKAWEGISPVQAVGVVRSVNVSSRKGGRKKPVESGEITLVEQRGVEGDGHAADWHRQVSLLAWESVLKAQLAGLDVKEGDFAENITTVGIDLLKYPLGTQFEIGETLIELSQIGKVCHTRCAIYYLAGDCIFPREGVFFVVLRGGRISVGDEIHVAKMGDGTCAFTPQEALDEIAQAWENGNM